MVEQRKFVSQIYLETFRSVTLSVGIIFRNPGDQTICWEFIHCAAQILVSDSDTWLCVESFFVRHISRLSGIIFRNPGNQTIYWEFIYCAAQILVSDSDTWWCVESFFVRSISRLSDQWPCLMESFLETQVIRLFATLDKLPLICWSLPWTQYCVASVKNRLFAENSFIVLHRY